MKKIAILCSAIWLGAANLYAQEAQNFDAETGRNNLASQCWIFSGTDLKTTGSESINSGASEPYVRTGQLTGTPNFLATPFMSFNGAGTLTFKHKLSANNGTTRLLRVYLLDINDNQVGAELYSWNYVAMEGPMTNRPRFFTTVRNATVAYNLTGDYRVVFEFSGTGATSRGVLDDIAFTSGSFVSDPANNCLPASSCTDSDNDNVCDAQDEFPNDPNRAYRSASTAFTYAFEDLWPATGDYDFNDAVIWYSSNYVLNGANQVVAMEWKSVTRAVGAGMQNGFALHFPSLSANSVTSVSGSVLNGNYVSNSANGTESGSNNAVVFIYESAEDVINRVGGPFYNTVPGAAMGISDTINITINFTSLANAPVFDPFLVVNQDRGREIHRSGWAPTSMANSAYFGTSQDDSNIGENRYYVTKQNFPWVVTIPGGFQYDYPAEKEDIVTGHLKFASWAQSSGASFSDWYEDETGYRNQAKIY